LREGYRAEAVFAVEQQLKRQGVDVTTGPGREIVAKAGQAAIGAKAPIPGYMEKEAIMQTVMKVLPVPSKAPTATPPVTETTPAIDSAAYRAGEWKSPKTGITYYASEKGWVTETPSGRPPSWVIREIQTGVAEGPPVEVVTAESIEKKWAPHIKEVEDRQAFVGTAEEYKKYRSEIQTLGRIQQEEAETELGEFKKEYIQDPLTEEWYKKSDIEEAIPGLPEVAIKLFQVGGLEGLRRGQEQEVLQAKERAEVVSPIVTGPARPDLYLPETGFMVDLKKGLQTLIPGLSEWTGFRGEEAAFKKKAPPKVGPFLQL